MNASRHDDMAAHHILEEVSCELCGSGCHKTLVIENSYLSPRMKLVQCLNCGLAFTNPRPTEIALKYIYSNENYVAHTASAAYCSTGAASRGQFTSALEVLKKMVQPPVYLLDVGCGTGHFLYMASQISGWNVQGVEISEYAAKEAVKRSGCCVHSSDLQTAKLSSESMDVVTLWYLLEHAAHPRQILVHANRILKPGGIILVAVPNFYYMLLKKRILTLSKKGDGILHLDEHLFHYAPDTLSRLLEISGFRPVVHAVAEPFFFSKGIKSSIKAMGLIGLRLLHRLTGINMGGILMIARKQG